jgi:hypothetical protein
MISYKRVDCIKCTSLGTWINGEYYRENLLKKYVYNKKRLKNDSDFGSMFQHDQARTHILTETRELLEEYNINVIEWPSKGADLGPIELFFGEIQQQAKEHYSNIKKKNNCGNISKILSLKTILQSSCKNVTIICLIDGSKFLKNKEL